MGGTPAVADPVSADDDGAAVPTVFDRDEPLNATGSAREPCCITHTRDPHMPSRNLHVRTARTWMRVQGATTAAEWAPGAVTMSGTAAWADPEYMWIAQTTHVCTNTRAQARTHSHTRVET